MVVKQGSGYIVKSHDGKKNLSRVYKTKAEAIKRLRQIEYFKHMNGAKQFEEEIDPTVTITRRANGSLSIAKVLVEMQEQGYVPIDYHLPDITFGPEDKFERQELFPEIQSLVEEAMARISDKGKQVIYTDVKGLVDVLSGKTINTNFCRDVKIILNTFNKPETIMLRKDISVDGLSFNDLKKLFEELKNNPDLFIDDWGYKNLRISVSSRIKKLRQGMKL